MSNTTAGQYRFVHDLESMFVGAAKVVPIVLELIGPVKSVIDLGGGAGGWLREFQRAGASKVRLLDGVTVAPYLVVPPDCLQAVDLESDLPALGKFDLAISLECAEHLSPRRSEPIVRWLTATSNVILFSAATRGQCGTGHINEQFPSYWQRLFRERGFTRRDVIRPRILFDENIPWWYRQNLFVFVKEGAKLATSDRDFLPDDFALLHHNLEQAYGEPTLRYLLKELPRATVATIRRRLR